MVSVVSDRASAGSLAAHLASQSALACRARCAFCSWVRLGSYAGALGLGQSSRVL